MTDTEIATLESEMADTNPASNDSYWHNPQKQERLSQLYEQQETGVIASNPTLGSLTPTEASELRSLVAELTDPDGKRFEGNWRDHISHNLDKQKRWAELSAKRDAAAGEVANTGQQMSPEVAAGWAESLAATPAEVQGGFERMQRIETVADDPDLAMHFDALTDTTQWWFYRMGAQPERAAEFAEQMDPASWAEFAHFIENSPPGTQAAIKAELGL